MIARLLLALALLVSGPAVAQQAISNLPQVATPRDADLLPLDVQSFPLGQRTHAVSAAGLAQYLLGKIPLGPQGIPGNTGPVGPANSLSVGTVSASDPGSNPLVSIVGTAPSQILNFTLPRGAPGPQGPQGLAGAIGPAGPQGIAGPTGAAGPPNVLSIGTVGTSDAGAPAAASVSGAAPNQALNLTLPRGIQGPIGPVGPTGNGTGNVLGPSGGSTAAHIATFSDTTGTRLSDGGVLGTAAAQPVAFFAQAGNNLSDLASSSAARANLGLGTLAVRSDIVALDSSQTQVTIPNSTGNPGVATILAGKLDKAGGDASGTNATASGGTAPLATWFGGYFGSVAALCDTSQWTGNVAGGNARPIPACFSSKMSNGINVPFAAVVGIAAGATNDQTHIQYGQHVISARTTKGNSSQESALVVNLVSQTGGGGAPGTNWNQKAAIYVPVLMVPGASNTWAFNPDLVIQAGVGDYSAYVSELDMSNFNKPYPVGGTVAAQTFHTFLSSYPVTAMDLASATTNADTITASTTAGSNILSAVSGISGPPLVAERITGPGIPAWTYVTAVNGDGTVTISNNATATASGVTLATQAFGAYNGMLYQGANLFRDNTFWDTTSSYTSLKIGGTHQVGFDTTAANLAYAMNAAAGQLYCYNSGNDCLTYDATNGLLRYSTAAGNALIIKDAGQVTALASFIAPVFQAPGAGQVNIGNVTDGTGLRINDSGGTTANYLAVQPATAGFGPAVKAAGSDTNIPLNLYGQGSSPVQVQSGFFVAGASSFTGISTFNGRTRVTNTTAAAAGTTQATATALSNDITIVTSGTGGVTLSNLTGEHQEVFNRSGAAINVYPALSAQIETAGVNTAVSVASGGHATFVCTSSTQCWQAP